MQKSRNLFWIVAWLIYSWYPLDIQVNLKSYEIKNLPADADQCNVKIRLTLLITRSIINKNGYWYLHLLQSIFEHDLVYVILAKIANIRISSYYGLK